MRYFFTNLFFIALYCLYIGCQTPTKPSVVVPQPESTSNIPPVADSTTTTNNTTSEQPVVADNGSTTAVPIVAVQGVLPPDEAAKQIGTLAQNAVNAIATKNYKLLASMVSPSKGLRCTPYIYVTDGDRVLMPTQIANAANDTKKYHWGEQDGSGEPIEMTINEYFNRYVYNYEYAKNGVKISYNQALGSGNSINNHRKIYPNAIVVEYHIPQKDPQYGGMDWGSLYLIYEPNASNWELVNIAHGQWTS